MQHHPKIVRRDVQSLANLAGLHLFHFPQHKDVANPLGKFGQAILKCVPEFIAVHHDLRFGFPFERAQVVIPEALWDELVSKLVLKKFEICETGFPTEFSKVVADLVLQDPAKPASFGRSSTKRAMSSDCGAKSFLDQIFRNVWSPDAEERIPIETITVLLHPAITLAGEYSG